VGKFLLNPGIASDGLFHVCVAVGVVSGDSETVECRMQDQKKNKNKEVGKEIQRKILL